MIHCTKVTYILEQLNDDVGLKRALQEYACVYRTYSFMNSWIFVVTTITHCNNRIAIYMYVHSCDSIM